MSARTLLLALLGALALGPVLADGAVPAETTFEARSLAPGVWVLRPSPADGNATNSLLVERADGLLVVDAQPTRADARRLLEVVARTSPKPLRYLVLSHAHAESAGGAAEFPESTLVVSRGETVVALQDPSFDFGAESRARASDPAAWTPPEIRVPVLVIHGRAELRDSMNRVELLPASPAHSATDLLVSLPDRGLLWAGAIAFPDRNPYGRGANVGGWVGALNQMAKMQPAIIVPLRGEPFDGRGVRVQREALAWLRGQIEKQFVDRVPAAQIPDRVLAAEDLDQYFDSGATPSFLRDLLEQAVDEAVTERRKRGLM